MVWLILKMVRVNIARMVRVKIGKGKIMRMI